MEASQASLDMPMERTMDRRKWIAALVVVLLVAAGAAAWVLLKGRAEGKAGAPGQASAGSSEDSRKNGAAAVPGKGKKGEPGKDEKAPVPVKTAVVAVAPVSSYITATANLVAENQVQVLSEAEGRVASVPLEEGTFVRKGQVLVQLVRGEAEMLAEKARVRARNARVAWQRASEMHAKGLVSQGDFDKTTMEKEVADQELNEAEWRLSKTTVRAPFDGTITERKVAAGQHVRPGEVLFTVTDFEPLVARIYLPERDVLALREGQEVRLTLRASDAIRFAGRIRQISPVVDTATGTVKVTVESVRPPEAVRPGAFVTADIVRETRSGAIVLPREAVIRELQDAHVFIADKGVARKRAVQLGIEEGDRIEAVSGVRAGEQVIVAGQGALKEGSPVKSLDAGRS